MHLILGISRLAFLFFFIAAHILTSPTLLLRFMIATKTHLRTNRFDSMDSIYLVIMTKSKQTIHSSYAIPFQLKQFIEHSILLLYLLKWNQIKCQSNSNNETWNSPTQPSRTDHFVEQRQSYFSFFLLRIQFCFAWRILDIAIFCVTRMKDCWFRCFDKRFFSHGRCNVQLTETFFFILSFMNQFFKLNIYQQFICIGSHFFCVSCTMHMYAEHCISTCVSIVCRSYFEHSIQTMHWMAVWMQAYHVSFELNPQMQMHIIYHWFGERIW